MTCTHVILCEKTHCRWELYRSRYESDDMLQVFSELGMTTKIDPCANGELESHDQKDKCVDLPMCSVHGMGTL